jgi:hypothetical protein
MSDTTYQAVKYVGTIATLLDFAASAQACHLRFADLFKSGTIARL